MSISAGITGQLKTVFGNRYAFSNIEAVIAIARPPLYFRITTEVCLTFDLMKTLQCSEQRPKTNVKNKRGKKD